MSGRMNKRKKQAQEAEMNIAYMQALQGKSVPLLSIDARWHTLFPDFRKTNEIKQLEKELNDLIKKQGQANNDLKEYEKAKKVLMQNIVNNMTDGHEADSPLRVRKQEKNQKLINDLNAKIAETKELQKQLPGEITAKNSQLLIACMRVCYQELQDNTVEIEERESQIRQLREEVKNHILRKQDLEMRNTEVYKYMHNLLGAEVVEVFDRKHRVWRGNMEENKLDDSIQPRKSEEADSEE
ncbi:MAG: hypothetical protein J1E62_03660 [Lachnospiraceae bacterium]|nr:hypothetical protein [Lachnospiraceae bacterium]